MSSLWRCDVCLNLIDPVEGEVRTVMVVVLDVDGEEDEQELLDLCEDCRPSTLGGHMDWLIHGMEEADV